MLTIFSACSKGRTVTADDVIGGPHIEVPGDTIPPVLSITTPVASQVFTSGNSINVTGRITDESGL